MLPDHTGVTFATNEITSAYSLDRDAMTGWFLHPQTPLDGCFNRPSLLEPETKQSWWSIQEEKEKTEDDIRRRMNLQTSYEDCQYKEANKFETQKKRDKNLDATLSSELLDEETYRNPRRSFTTEAQEALDLLAQADDLARTRIEAENEYNRLV